MDEIWKSVKGYEGWYEISNLGNIRSIDRRMVYSNGRKRFQKGKILKQTLRKNGYFYVTLAKNQKVPKFDIQVLVAEAFIDNPNNYPCVNHLDCNKQNNIVDNLEWCTYKENSLHASKNGLYVKTNGEINGMSKLTSQEVIEIRELISKGVGYNELVEKYNVSKPTLSNIKTRKTWSHI